MAYLKEIGINRFDVDATQYDPATTQTYTRPDRAEAMRKAHEAVEHDKWFREQVALSLKEADAPATIWLPHTTRQKPTCSGSAKACWLAPGTAE